MVSTAPPDEIETLLTWRVHLLKRDPGRLSVLAMTLFIGGACVWLLFHNLLPVVAALLLLVSAASEYLFPITYQITHEDVRADSPTSRMKLRWKDVQRVLPGPKGVVLTPLPVPSRLDAFRGVLLRFAPDGEPGDRASVMAVLQRYLAEGAGKNQFRQ